MPPEKKPRGRLRQCEVFFPLTIVAHHSCPIRRLSWSYPESSRFSIVLSSFPIVCVEDVNIVSVAFLVSEEYSIIIA